MEKIWFFVEGDSEENFIKNLIRIKYSESILLEQDPSVFVDKDLSDFTHHLCYCENCHSVGKIPHRINDLSYLIEKSESSNLLVVCDLEKLDCFRIRKNLIESVLENSINSQHIHYAFFKPMIETGYLGCEEIIKKIIKREYKIKFNKDYQGEIALEINYNKPLISIQKSFKKYNIKYRESKFSERFFPQVDFNSCQNAVLHRIVSHLDHI